MLTRLKLIDDFYWFLNTDKGKQSVYFRTWDWICKKREYLKAEMLLWLADNLTEHGHLFTAWKGFYVHMIYSLALGRIEGSDYPVWKSIYLEICNTCDP